MDGALSRPIRIGFLLVPQYSMIAFAAALEPLRIANRMADRPLYEWTLYSRDGGAVAASNGVETACSAAFAGARGLDMAIVCAGLDVQSHDHGELTSVLRRMNALGTALGAVCTGTYVLALAGLLGGHRTTIHWENRPSLMSRFPDLDITSDLFVIDRRRYTCAGGTAAADMMLSLILQDHGADIAFAVAEQMIHHRIREPGEGQRVDLRTRLGIANSKLVNVVALMERTIEKPLTSAELAASVNISPRQLERLFLKHLGRSPTRHYLSIRLEQARFLLRQTSMPVLSIALACGFVSASHFSQSYAEWYGRSPSVERGKPPSARSRALAATFEG
ncbi:GlxA family transcriptional regulator [Aurantimonas sp. MSK8Z-1]|uniref:GlxA family transcriptional regulator n=1 Tax=Mangrovibrevibacter kandeliae TaxID=2968473 RepID=UPI002117F610|nr:GlxA family transcriptional regulator [Aurantimonas sp. MSK8Z-1]MCW4113553.1 GlxA family transcriptional regulator [Aurantimonas sp. MSK8Z-1]